MLHEWSGIWRSEIMEKSVHDLTKDYLFIPGVHKFFKNSLEATSKV